MLVRSVWQEPAPTIGHHLPGGAFALDADPPPERSIDLGSTRALHGLVTAISGLPHHPTVPTIVLGPWPEGLGWAAYVCTDGAARAVAGRTHTGAHLFGRRVNVRCGPLMRLRSPLVSDVGPRDLVVRTQTPLVIRGNGRVNDAGRTGAGTRRRLYVEQPESGVITSTLWSWLPRRVGLQIGPDVVRTDLVSARGRARTVHIGAHLGRVRGWEGVLHLRTNAVGEWLWRLGALIGVGGRVGFGFGRVEVERVEPPCR